MVLLTILAAALAGVFLLPTVSDLLAMLRLAAGGGRRHALRSAANTRFLFLIPAHNEESLVASCVASVKAMNYPRDRVTVTVVADNCTDGTASVALAHGATCMERDDRANPGKPRAVAWALAAVNLDAHDAVVILDADAVVDKEYATALDRMGPLGGKAFECYDDVRNRTDSPLTRMAAVLSAARFRGSFRLKHRLGLTVPLSDGMCIGVDVLHAHPWSAFGLSEDWEVYAILTAAGVPVELAEGAHLYAQEAHTLKQSSSQRSRWLAGRVDALRRLGPPIVRSGKIGFHQKLDAIAELASPGPAVQFAVCAALAIALVFTDAPAGAPVATALIVSLARPAAWAVVGLSHDPEPLRALAAFAVFPFYSAWRAVIAVRSMSMVRGATWVRTART